MKKIFKFIKIVLLILIVVVIVKAFFLDAFRIPSESMENTLLVGDNIIVNKMAYNFSTPREIPIINFPLPYSVLFETGNPGINDHVVFEFPKGYMRDSLMENSHFIKRIIAGPGDTLQIINKEFFVNGKKLEMPSTVIVTKEKQRAGWIQDEGIYPPGSKWNRDNYGPIIVPAKGDTINISPQNFERLQPVIVMDHGERSLLREGTVITLDGKPVEKYVLTQDHYFVIGDNIDVSMDSRYFGFITEKMMIGKALFIYWSVDKNKVAPGPLGFLSAIRSNRIFKGVE